MWPRYMEQLTLLQILASPIPTLKRSLKLKTGYKPCPRLGNWVQDKVNCKPSVAIPGDRLWTTSELSSFSWLEDARMQVQKTKVQLKTNNNALYINMSLWRISKLWQWMQDLTVRKRSYLMDFFFVFKNILRLLLSLQEVCQIHIYANHQIVMLPYCNL